MDLLSVTVVPLKVSGPFHTIYMEPAAYALYDLFQTISFAEEKMTVLYNVLGGPRSAQDSISDLLVRQVKSPVKMLDCIKYLFEQGVNIFLEIGPGNTLQGFVNKTAKSLGKAQEDYQVVSINTSEDLNKTIGLLQLKT